jgi:hypothetical protein
MAMAHSGQLGYADQSYAQQINVGNNAPKAIPLVDQQVDRVNSNARVLEALAHRLHDVADRLFGGCVQGKEGAEKAPSPTSSLGRLAEAHDWNDRALTLLKTAVDRLEAL